MDVPEPEITLFDLACNKNEPFSPLAWTIRLMLNYKHIPYRTVFLEFPDIEPTLKGFGIPPHEAEYVNYTIPAIHHIPTNRYIMDSSAISEFIESNYPDRKVPLTSELGLNIQNKAQGAINTAFRNPVTLSIFHMISPRAQVYFRDSRERMFGHPLEDLGDPRKQEEAWQSADDDLRAASDLMLTNSADGPFVLGAQPSFTDFWIVGRLECARVPNKDVFERVSKYPGFKKVYEACLPYMEKKD